MPSRKKIWINYACIIPLVVASPLQRRNGLFHWSRRRTTTASRECVVRWVSSPGYEGMEKPVRDIGTPLSPVSETNPQFKAGTLSSARASKIMRRSVLILTLWVTIVSRPLTVLSVLTQAPLRLLPFALAWSIQTSAPSKHEWLTS